MAGRDRPLLLLMRQVAIGYAASRFGSELFGDDVAGFRPGSGHRRRDLPDRSAGSEPVMFDHGRSISTADSVLFRRRRGPLVRAVQLMELSRPNDAAIAAHAGDGSTSSGSRRTWHDRRGCRRPCPCRPVRTTGAAVQVRAEVDPVEPGGRARGGRQRHGLRADPPQRSAAAIGGRPLFSPRRADACSSGRRESSSDRVPVQVRATLRQTWSPGWSVPSPSPWIDAEA
jgi:hypothetical protein